MKKLLFILGRGIYPNTVGGMEIFNYYLIKDIKKEFNVSYTSTIPLDIDGVRWMNTYSIKPIKLFSPLQVLLRLLFHPSIKKVVISYSAAHWLVWYLYTMINTVLGRDYYIVIHYGDATPANKINVYKKFFNKAKRVIAVSHDIKKNYDSKYNINCEILYPLVPFEKCKTDVATLRNEFNIPSQAYLITMVGSVKDMKNPDTLLEALSMFTKEELEKYNIHIAYAGRGNMVETLKERAKEKRLDNRVHFLGFVPKEEVNKVFKMSNAYTIASDFEGTSVSLLEAMFNKKAILASNAPGIKDMVKDQHSALMFETRNTAELNERIRTLLDSPTLAKELSENAHKHYITNYSYQDMLCHYINIFNE